MYVLALSNTIKVNELECHTAVIKYRHIHDAFGFDYTTFPDFHQQVRLGLDLRKFKYPEKMKQYRQSNGVFRQSGYIDKTREMHTDMIDEPTADALSTALKHSELFIDDTFYSSQGELEIEDNDFNNLANAKATLHVQGYNKTTQSC